MARERAINKLVVAIPIEIETLTKVRSAFGREGDSRSDYVLRALKESVKDVQLTAEQLLECRTYTQAQYEKRLAQRSKKPKVV